jgi:hypothetical protein
LELRVLFTGLSAARARSIVKTLEKAQSPAMEATIAERVEEGQAALASRLDAVFVSTEIGSSLLTYLIEETRRRNSRVAIILTYGSEPGGKAFDLARRHECRLFSEMDRLQRGLTVAELAEELGEVLEVKQIRSRLMEVSLSSGPCSTGD